MHLQVMVGETEVYTGREKRRNSLSSGDCSMLWGKRRGSLYEGNNE